MNHLYLPFLDESTKEAPSGLQPLWVEIMLVGISPGDFDLLSYKQNTPSTPHLMQVVPDALHGSFLSRGVRRSAGELAVLTLVRTLNMQLVLLLGK